MKKINSPIIKLILIIRLFISIMSKSILIANDISNVKFISETNEYIFNIKASLTGNLSKNMFENINIIINNDNKLKTICKFPEEKINVYNKAIIINCSINNMIYDKFSISFKGTNNYIDLINFNEKILYVDKTLSKNDIILMMGEIKEQKCQKKNELYYYNYKIKIENKTIPKIIEKYNYDYDLKPNGLDNNQYNITCNIINTNIDKYMNCSLVYKNNNNNNNILYYEHKYIYHKEINNNIIIYFVNNNENLYLGKNIKCEYIKNNNNDRLKLRILDVGNIYDNDNVTDNTTIFSYDSIADDDEDYTSQIDSTSMMKPDCKNGTFYNEEDNNCIKCQSTCEECESKDICTKCKKGYVLKDNKCISCFAAFEGCQNCTQNKCTNCYSNSLFQYSLINDKCENELNSTDNNNNNKASLKFERLDGYEQVGDIIYFKSHFVLLNSYLYNSVLTITANVQTNPSRYLLRNLNLETITCTQYGDALGIYNKGGYLANFLCEFILGQNIKLVSIEPTKFKINNNNNINIQDNQKKVFTSEELNETSLDEDYENNSFNKFNIANVTSVKLKKELTFDINGKFESNITNNNNYEIIIKNTNNDKITGNCTTYKDSQSLSCTGIYKPYQNKELLILSNPNTQEIKIPKKKISVGAIIGITIAGIIILIPFVFYVTKYLIRKKDNNDINPYEDIEENKEGNRNPKTENSKEIIFNHYS